MAKRKQPERGLHGYVADLIRLAGIPNLIALHIPNEGRRSPRQGAFLKRMMMLPGAADFSITLPGARQRYLELKSATGTLSPEQRAFRDLCEANGTPYAIARTPDEAKAILTQWGCLRSAAKEERRAA